MQGSRRKSQEPGLFGVDARTSEHPDMAPMGIPRRHQPRVMEPIHNGTETSRAAALALTPEWRATVCGRIYCAIEEAPAGLTREEISHQLNMPIQTVCARIADLRRMGLIDEPRHLTRATSTGAQAQVVLAKGGV